MFIRSITVYFLSCQNIFIVLLQHISSICYNIFHQSVNNFFISLLTILSHTVNNIFSNMLTMHSSFCCNEFGTKKKVRIFNYHENISMFINLLTTYSSIMLRNQFFNNIFIILLKYYSFIQKKIFILMIDIFNILMMNSQIFLTYC